MRRQIDLKPLAHGPENGRKLVHAGIAFGRKHPVQTIDCAILAMSHDGHVAGAVLTVMGVRMFRRRVCQISL
jgi:hypothetical protein